MAMAIVFHHYRMLVRSVGMIPPAIAEGSR
jgi:hypothetical protein